MGGDSGSCAPSSYRNAGFSSACEYVLSKAADCEGGGYIPWMALEVCASTNALRIVVVLLAFLFLLYIFLLLSVAADDFFCANIATIVDHHKISQNIAGITLMAFGNGAPDIFSSIASVISVKEPQAGLAISELLGGGIFVTTMVVATVIMVKPFNVMRRPAIRDLSFYLAALAFLVFVVNYDTNIHLWQPLVFLLLYLIYAFVVISGGFVRRSIKRRKRRTPDVFMKNKTLLKITSLSLLPAKNKSRVAPEDSPTGKPADSIILTPTTLEATGATMEEITQSTLIIPVGNNPLYSSASSSSSSEDLQAKDYLEAGKFFGKERMDEEREEEDDSSSSTEAPSFAVVAVRRSARDGAGVSGLPVAFLPQPLPRIDTAELSSGISENSHRSPSPLLGSRQTDSRCHCVCAEFGRLLKLINPFDRAEYAAASLVGKLYHIVKCPWTVTLRLSVPLSTREWCKLLAVLHAFATTFLFCAAFQILELPWFPHGPHIWVLSLIISIVVSLAICIFTSTDREPRFYRQLSAYTGFVLSIAWIYAAASEVVNVITMFGYFFGVSYQVMGVTAVAWANSIGDMMADTSVAKQGFPRMAFSAAFGAPLFNLMVGFGATFLIAKAQGKAVRVETNAVNTTMFAALGASLTLTMVLLFAQKFHVRRTHAILLYALYAAFIVVVVLNNQGIIR